MSQWENVYAAGQQLNRYPFAEVVSFVKRFGREKPLATCHALDVGCGSGVHAQLLAHEGARVSAFDGSPSAIKHAHELHGDDLISYSVATLASYEIGEQPLDLVVDRLSSTNAAQHEVAEFYGRLRASLAPNARLLWQGFDTENSGRGLALFDDSAKVWTDFSGGVFAPKDTISFFAEDDLDTVFEGYEIASKRIISDTNLQTGYRHSYWNLELFPAAS